MKFKKKILLIIFFVTLFGFIFTIKQMKPKKTKIEDNLINISDLSEDFMNNYLDEVKQIKESDEENILIVISENGIRNNYGATKVIEAPNSQYILQYNSKENKDTAFVSLKNDKSIYSVEENIIYYATENSNTLDYNSWGIEKMNINGIFDNVFPEKLTDVTVAIIDSGCNMELFNESFNEKIENTINFYDNNTMYDDFGHGTHIAGTIAEATPNNVKILPIKVSNSRSMSNVYILAAINYIAYYEKADVINMSFGSSVSSEAEHVAIEAANKKNIISVAAAGNDNSSNNNYPSSYENTISIAAVDENKEKAEFSNYGNTITFSAPGVDIQSINGGMSGTSMATPHAVSAVAILKSLNKNISLSDTITLLRRYSEDLGDTGWDKYFGYGFINFDNVQICDGTNCDEYNVFKSFSSDDLENVVKSYEINPNITSYDYGTINNILNTVVVINYINGQSISYRLYEFEDLEISGYDPNKIGTDYQNVNIKFTTPLGVIIEDSIKIRHTTKKESVWSYNKLDDNNIELTDFKDTNFMGNKIYFPSTIDGYNVIAIADLKHSIFESSRSAVNNVESLYLPSTIIKLGNNAFNSTGLNNLQYVKSDASNLNVGNYAFYDSKNLMRLEANVSYIGDYAFYKTASVDGMKLDSNLNYIGQSSFSYSSYYEEFVIPQKVETIGTDALSYFEISSIKFLNAIEKIPSKMFEGNSKLTKVILPEGLKEIESYAFSGCYNIKEIYMSKSINIIANDAFNSANLLDLIFYVYSNSYSKEFFNGNDVYKYIQIDPDIININSKKNYNAFDIVNFDDLTVELIYNEKTTRKETLNTNIQIEYQSSEDGFRYGDNYFRIKTYNKMNYLIEKNVDVSISKAKPEYSIPINLTAELGDKLFDVELPQNFSWMGENRLFETNGKYSFKAKYVPLDTVNYETIENIDIEVSIGRQYIVNNTEDFAGIYDGNDHTLNIDVNVDDYTINYSTDGNNYNLNVLPKYSEVGENTIYYKITADGYEDLIGSNKVKIYGIKNIDSSITVKNDILIVNNNSFNNLINLMGIYSLNNSIKHLDNYNNILTADQIKTGDSVKININNLKDFEYKLSYLGDVNGNGNIDIIDYIRIMKDIMGTSNLSGVYYEAADMNRNNQIDIIDYIRVMKIIMEEN